MAGEIKQRMIERTAVLLASKGLQGASFSEILEASGAPRGSLYHHFPGGKDELVLAALGHAGDRALNALRNSAGQSPRDVAKAFLALWRMVLERTDFGAGCAVAAVTIATDAPALRQRAADIFRNWREQLGELFHAGGMTKPKAQAAATMLVAACEGATILARAERSFVPFDLVAAAQLEMIDAAMKA